MGIGAPGPVLRVSSGDRRLPKALPPHAMRLAPHAPAAACRLFLASVAASMSCGGAASEAQAAWSVTRLGSTPLNVAASPAPETSGLAYLGPSSTPGRHRFAAATENSGYVALVDVQFAADGLAVAAEAVAVAPLAGALDFEGLAFTGSARGSVWMCDETGPGLREFSLAHGGLLQSVALPTVFSQHVANKSLESLILQRGRQVLWTANEEALAVDGPVASVGAGTVVRLLELPLSGSTPTPAAQYAYEVEGVHANGLAPQSGLVELVALPDGTLLALERSFSALANPTFLNRIFALDFSAATDVSGAEFSHGLAGKEAAFEKVRKTLLWSGTADGLGGQNLEGLALGPELSPGRWALVGVVDDGDALSSGLVVSFVVSAAPSGDFTDDGRTDGDDLLVWQRGRGRLEPGFPQGDANRDGVVDALDLKAWEAAYGFSPGATIAIPEPRLLAWALPLWFAGSRGRRRQRTLRPRRQRVATPLPRGTH